jgi:quercetin dioxygenase-like cupin family protein
MTDFGKEINSTQQAAGNEPALIQSSKLVLDSRTGPGIELAHSDRATLNRSQTKKEVSMKLLNVLEMAKERKIGQRRLDLFRRENLETWILWFPPGDVQIMHNHPSDRTYYVLTGKGIMKGLNESHEVSQGQIISIPAHEFYEGSNPYDEPMILLGNSHKATAEDVAKAGGQRNEIDKKTGKRIIYQHGGGQDMGVLAD